MRRTELEITDRAEIERILDRALVCRLAMCDAGRPYVVPLSFGYARGALYFHASRTGAKIDMLRANPYVCFEVDIDHELVLGEDPCKASIKYKSVVGFGTAVFVEDAAERRKGLEILRDHYSKSAPPYKPGSFEKVAVIRVDIESMTGRARN